jgi:predicted alpha/beta-hydrolase family hydrolase
MTSVLSPDGTKLPVRVVAARNATATLVLAPGAGSSMKHPAIVRLQDGIAARRITVATFDFPYRVRGGGAPDRQPVLVGAYGAVVDAVRAAHPGRLFAGGRSMGGRMASHLATIAPLDGLVFVSFPLHPPGKPGIERAAHLATLKIPMLFVQGTRDTFAREDLLAGVLKKLPRATLHAIPDADHGMHVPKRTGRTDADVLTETIDTIVEWIGRV